MRLTRLQAGCTKLSLGLGASGYHGVLTHPLPGTRTPLTGPNSGSSPQCEGVMRFNLWLPPSQGGTWGLSAKPRQAHSQLT